MLCSTQHLKDQSQDLRKLKEELAHVNQILGDGKKRIQPTEIRVKQSARRSLVARMDISAGTVLTKEMIAFKRPGTGISPSELEAIIGKSCKKNIHAEQVIDWEMF